MASDRIENLQSRTQSRGDASGQQTGGNNEQAGSAVNRFTETSSELWDDVYDQGERYYRQGRRAIGDLDGVTLGGLIAAGALGFAVAWMMFNNRTDWVAERMSESSDRDGMRERQGRGKHRRS